MIILMLLENKLFTNKSQNPTSTGETAGDNAENLMEPNTVPLFELNQTRGTQVNWERIYGSPRQQINQPIATPGANRFQ